MAKTKEYKCNRCGDFFEARMADRARGWARFCSKSCKAIKQTYGKNSFKPVKKECFELSQMDMCEGNIQ